MAIISNKKNGSVVIHETANVTYAIAGNNSTSNVAILDELVDGVEIRRVIWGTDTGQWTVKRGANTVLVLSGTNELLLNGCAINKDKGATLVITLSGGTGFLMLELSKQGTFPTNY